MYNAACMGFSAPLLLVFTKTNQKIMKTPFKLICALFFTFSYVTSSGQTDLGDETTEVGSYSIIDDIDDYYEVVGYQLMELSTIDLAPVIGAVDETSTENIGKPYTVSYTFTNPTTVPIAIGKIATGCGCIKTDFDHVVVNPGTSKTIQIKFELMDNGPIAIPITIYGVDAQSRFLKVIKPVVLLKN